MVHQSNLTHTDQAVVDKTVSDFLDFAVTCPDRDKIRKMWARKTGTAFGEQQFVESITVDIIHIIRAAYEKGLQDGLYNSPGYDLDEYCEKYKT